MVLKESLKIQTWCRRGAPHSFRIIQLLFKRKLVNTSGLLDTFLGQLIGGFLSDLSVSITQLYTPMMSHSAGVLDVFFSEYLNVDVHMC